MTLKAAELVPIDTPENQIAYDAALAESGRSYTKLQAAHVPSSEWDFNSGGEGNQQDDPLRHYLAWRWYGDELALQSGFSILSYLADNFPPRYSSTGRKIHSGYQNGHGQRHPNFGLYALIAKERGDEEMAAKLIAAEVKLYSLNLASKEWASDGATNVRPGSRFTSTTARLCVDVPKLQAAGLIHPDQFPGEYDPGEVLARFVKWVERWLWKMQGAFGGEGWTVAPGLYRYDEDERDWLNWSQKTSDSIETNDTAFMHYSIFPRDFSIALTWLEAYSPVAYSLVRKLWTARLRDMATWSLAVAYDPATGLAKRAQDWSPDILEARGPFRLYASTDTGEKTHSIAATIAASKAPKERRCRELVNALKKGMKLAPGEVDEGLVIAAMALGFGAS